MLLRVAAAVDRARERRQAAELNHEVDDAVRAFEREQLALLHDTAASTLLMVGQGARLPPQRLAAQARRDLDLLHDGPWRPTPARMELVGALRAAVAHARTPASLVGPERLWMTGELVAAVVAAAREALNNVDRHAHARSVTVEIAQDQVRITDDGVGFDAEAPVRGHGIADSMTARMARVGGVAALVSSPGSGTCVRLSWSSVEPVVDDVVIDPDRLIDRVRLIYVGALALYAIANLLTTVPYAVAHTGRPAVQLALAIVAAVCPPLALPALRGRAWVPPWAGIAALVGVLLAQELLLNSDKLGSQADWVQAGIGWCVLPLALTLPIRRAAAVVVGFWVLGAVVELTRHPVGEAFVNVGLGTGSILGVQLFALAFDGLVRDAAVHVHADVEAHRRLVVAERVARAVAEDYRRRYAKLVDNVVPLLQRLSTGDPVTHALQREARAESRRLRALFDQTKTFEHSLLRQLRPAVDAVEARGIDVVVDVSGELGLLGPEDVRRLVDPVCQALSGDMSSAHVVVSAGPGTLSLSVVCRGVADPAAAAERAAGSGAEVIAMAETVWVIVEYPPRSIEGATTGHD
jgi:hypothetical protein